MSNGLSVPARLVIMAIGIGMRLRCPHDGSDASLVDEPGPPMVLPEHYRFPIRPAIGPLERTLVCELLESGVLEKMPRHRENDRAGWQSRGLDGDVADFYRLCPGP